MFTSYSAWEELVRENRLLRDNFNRAREENVRLLEDYRNLARELAREIGKRRTKQKTLGYKLALLEQKLRGLKDENPPPVEPPFRPAENDFARYLLEHEVNRMALDGLRFVNALPFRPCTGPASGSDPEETSLVHWVLPDFGPGAGGHQTIFRMVHALEQGGYRQKIWIYGPTRYAGPAAAQEVIRNSFAPIAAEVGFLSPENVETVSGAGAVATDRWSAYFVRAIGQVRKRFYFVQDWEPDFYAAGSEALLSRATYRFGFIPITAGEWLKERLVEEGFVREGDPLYSFPLAVDHTIYTPPEENGTNQNPPRIAFYARMNTPRRSVELGLLALEKLAERGVDFVVDLFGDPASAEWGCRFPAVHHGIVTAQQLAGIYRGAALGLCLSSTNYSLIPLEMMASGCPVVELDLPCTRRIFPESVISRGQPSPEGLAATLQSLLEDPARRAAQREAGLAHARSFAWEKSAARVKEALDRELTWHLGSPDV